MTVEGIVFTRKMVARGWIGMSCMVVLEGELRSWEILKIIREEQRTHQANSPTHLLTHSLTHSLTLSLALLLGITSSAISSLPSSWPLVFSLIHLLYTCTSDHIRSQMLMLKLPVCPANIYRANLYTCFLLIDMHFPLFPFHKPLVPTLKSM